MQAKCSAAGDREPGAQYGRFCEFLQKTQKISGISTMMHGSKGSTHLELRQLLEALMNNPRPGPLCTNWQQWAQSLEISLLVLSAVKKISDGRREFGGKSGCLCNFALVCAKNVNNLSRLSWAKHDTKSQTGKPVKEDFRPLQRAYFHDQIAFLHFPFYTKS